MLNKSDYFYNLPEELIAQKPLEKRDSSRLLVYDRKSGEISHKVFSSVIDYLNSGDVLVINTTRVLPARLFAFLETGGKIEVFLLKRINLTDWEVLVKPGRKAKIGKKLIVSEELSLTVLSQTESGERIVRFEFNGVFEDILSRVGNVPLPPYIKEKLKDGERYQTVYSEKQGSSAAPTAGLHFTKELLEKIGEKGVKIARVNLDIGLGTFRPVKEENILNHKMHEETFEIDEVNAEIINTARKNGKKVFAVGTTSVRVLESVADESGEMKAKRGSTSIFIYPGYKFKCVDALITNFHLPESTLIMLVSAFAGRAETLKVYEEAVKREYRFFSFGDACLFL